jgi:hypothetical protein
MDAFKKSHAPGGLILLVAGLMVNECRYPADQLPAFIVQEPPGGFSMLKIDIFIWIKDRIDLLIKRTDPGRIVPVEDPGHFQEGVGRPPVFYFHQVHHSLL